MKTVNERKCKQLASHKIIIFLQVSVSVNIWRERRRGELFVIPCDTFNVIHTGVVLHTAERAIETTDPYSAELTQTASLAKVKLI